METIIVAVRNDAGANFGAFVGGSLVGARFLNEVLVISGPAFATQFESVSITFTAMEQSELFLRIQKYFAYFNTHRPFPFRLLD